MADFLWFDIIFYEFILLCSAAVYTFQANCWTFFFSFAALILQSFWTSQREFSMKNPIKNIQQLTEQSCFNSMLVRCNSSSLLFPLPFSTPKKTEPQNFWRSFFRVFPFWDSLVSYPITRLPLLSSKSFSMASVLEIYYPMFSFSFYLFPFSPLWGKEV